jgi:cell division septum initiation protein DivIVA
LALPPDSTGSALPPDRTGVVQFDVVMRGYDRRQVDDYIASLYAAHAKLQAELRRGRPSFEALGERVSQILVIAEAEADEMREHARQDAAQTRRQAEVEAEALGAAARRELEELEERRTALLADLGTIRAAADQALVQTDVVWPSETVAAGSPAGPAATPPRSDS